MNSGMNIKKDLNSLHLSDIYSLLLFILYKVQDIPEYATLSELCYLLDGSNLNRLFTYFAGQDVKIPSKEDMSIVANALLLYQYVQVDGMTYTDAHAKLSDLSPVRRQKVTDLYLKLLPILATYNIDRTQVQKNER